MCSFNIWSKQSYSIYSTGLLFILWAFLLLYLVFSSFLHVKFYHSRNEILFQKLGTNITDNKFFRCFRKSFHNGTQQTISFCNRTKIFYALFSIFFISFYPVLFNFNATLILSLSHTYGACITHIHSHTQRDHSSARISNTLLWACQRACWSFCWG